MKKIKLNNDKRLIWVDIAKGITIILVIFGHMNSNNATFSLFREIIFSFHMPLFFIVSSLHINFLKMTMN